MKKFFMTILRSVASVGTVFLMLSLAACGQFAGEQSMYHADYPYFSSIDELTAEADLIIIGETVSANNVEKLKTSSDSDDALPYTMCEVRITQVIKGTAEVGEIITVKQFGDFKKMPDSALKELDGYIKKDSTNLMFLRVFDGVPSEPLSPYQGVVSIENGKLVSKSKYSLFGFENNESVEDAVDSIGAVIEIRSKGD